MRAYVNLTSGNVYTEIQTRSGLLLQMMKDEKELECCRQFLGKKPDEHVTMVDMSNYLENTKWNVVSLDMCYNPYWLRIFLFVYETENSFRFLLKMSLKIFSPQDWKF